MPILGKEVVLVAAMARNRVIGLDGHLPWRLKSDLQSFKAITMGKPVLMGRTTFDSLRRPLPGRDNLVLTRNIDRAFTGARAYGSLGSLLAAGAGLAHCRGQPGLSVIGGAQLYAQALPYADRIVLSVVDLEAKGDTVFPELGAEWHCQERVPHDRGPDDDAAFVVETWVRAGSAA